MSTFLSNSETNSIIKAYYCNKNKHNLLNDSVKCERLNERGFEKEDVMVKNDLPKKYEVLCLLFSFQRSICGS